MLNFDGMISIALVLLALCMVIQQARINRMEDFIINLIFGDEEEGDTPNGD